MNAEVIELINQITRQRKLDREFVVNALRDAIATAVRKYKGPDYPVEVSIDPRRGDISITVEKRVVEKPSDPDFEISLEEARKISPEVKPGDKVNVNISYDSFGRGMVYRIQNLFMQKIREAERQHIYRNFQERVGDLMTGVIQKVDKTGVYITLGNAEAILPPEEQIPGERYKQGGNIRALVLKVEEARRGRPQIVLSRTHPDFLKKLIEFEIPEVTEGTVEVRAVARIPGKRAKIAVRSKDPKVDPVGACIGVRGTRIQPVVRELCGEKIDVIKWDPDPIKFAASAMSPSEPLVVYREDEKIVVVVPDEKVPDAKGKEAQNVILASKLVGKEIVVISESEHKGPKDSVSILELPVPEEVIQKLRENEYFVFEEVPSLAEIMSCGIDEGTALKILESVEDLLEKKRRSK
jgi:N utilization substance protein A